MPTSNNSSARFIVAADSLFDRYGKALRAASSRKRFEQPLRPAAYVEAVKEAGEDLCQRLGLEPSFFDDSARAFMFVAAADCWAAAHRASDAREVDAVWDAARKLTSEYSQFNLDESRNGRGALYAEAPEITQRIIDGYLEHEDEFLSQKLDELTRRPHPVIQETRERLGIVRPDQEKPFKLFVVRAADDAFINYPSPPTANAGETVQSGFEGEIKRYAALVRNESALTQRFSPNHVRGATAWVMRLAGEQSMFIRTPTAERLLDPSFHRQLREEKYDQGATDQTVLGHEYAHTQMQLTLGQLGHMSDEELAEGPVAGLFHHVSAHYMLRGIEALSPVSPLKLLAQAGASSDPSGFYYPRLVQAVGMRHALLVSAIDLPGYASRSDRDSGPGAYSFDELFASLAERQEERFGYKFVKRGLDALVSGLEAELDFDGDTVTKPGREGMGL